MLENKEFHINHFRTHFYEDRTIGTVDIPGYKRIFTLEDKVRDKGVKIKGSTAIPENTLGYKCKIHKSNRFGREVIMLYTSGVELAKDGISFSYIYLHGGNKPQDTEGCILIANFVDYGKRIIYGTAENIVFASIKNKIEEGYEVYWHIFNHGPNYEFLIL